MKKNMNNSGETENMLSDAIGHFHSEMSDLLAGMQATPGSYKYKLLRLAYILGAVHFSESMEKIASSPHTATIHPDGKISVADKVLRVAHEFRTHVKDLALADLTKMEKNLEAGTEDQEAEAAPDGEDSLAQKATLKSTVSTLSHTQGESDTSQLLNKLQSDANPNLN